ncbi:hypothetical protein [Bacteroides reticulotermitis]|nr:hypothetical protein [Bacteroides reticulotermitis]MBB4044222.1 hypothetical protein [Bacteroides reticulotermitis]
MKITKKLMAGRLWGMILLLFSSTTLCACSGSSDETKDKGENEVPAENVTVKITADKNTVLRNPLNGWVMYMGRSWDENFWTSEGYDAVYVPDIGKTVKVSDYASTCYIRTSWSSLNPAEGEYVWDNPNARLTKLFQSALNRNMRLSFRIVVDGRDQGLNTPQYVFDAGAEWYPDPNGNNGENRKSPYPDDEVFQTKYAKFIEAFAKKFDDPDKVDFIDAYGLGKWGEAHSMVYKDYANKSKVFEWVTSLYTRCFKKVPLVINYHRLVGANNTSGWGAVAPDTEQLMSSAINKGYSLRHDAFGMNGYYQDWEKQFAERWNYKRPIIMEGGWITGGTHRYWIDPSGKYREGHPEDVRQGEFDASAEAHVNMMDLRVGDETNSWFTKCFSLVQRFITEGGYRLYPDMVSLPKEISSGKQITIIHRWNNLGWGYCPTNIPQWNQRYKVAFALLDSKNEPKKIVVDQQTDLSTWLKGKPTTYNFDLNIKGVTVGAYTWAVGLVDTTKDNAIGLQMAIKGDVLPSGWAKLMTVTVK